MQIRHVIGEGESATAKHQPIRVDQLTAIKAIARDTLIILALALLGLSVVPFADGSPANLMRARISLAASIFLFVIAGFSFSGYRTPRRRWIHLIRVTACVWLLSLAYQALLGLPVVAWFLTGVFLLVAMGIGGVISLALRKDPGDTPTRSGSVEPSTHTPRAGTPTGDRISWLKGVGAVLSSNLFLGASFIGIFCASIPVMMHMGGKYAARGEVPYSNMIVMVSIPDLDSPVPGQRKLEPVTLRSLPEFQSIHPDHTFVIPAGSGHIDRTSYRATALGAGEVRVETDAHYDDPLWTVVAGSYEATEREVRPIYTNHTFASGGIFFGAAGAGILRMIGSLLQWVQRRRQQRDEPPE